MREIREIIPTGIADESLSEFASRGEVRVAGFLSHIQILDEVRVDLVCENAICDRSEEGHKRLRAD